MNIGIVINHYEGTLEDRFARAEEQGFHHCQLISWEPALWTDKEAEKVNTMSKQHDVKITAFWCGWSGPKAWNFIDGPETLGIVPVAYRAQRVQNLLDGAAFAKKLHVNDIVTHAGFIPEDISHTNYPGVRAAVAEIASKLKANEQNLLFETGQETPVVLLRLIEDVGTGNLFVNLDPANLIMYGKANPVDALDVFGAYVRGVHAKDGLYPTNGRELGLEVRVGTGKVDFSKLLKGLKAHGYDASLTIEREISGDQQVADILITKAYLQNILDQMEE